VRFEVGELRASRTRLALGADADRRRIERELHDGLQQELAALSVSLQIARRLVDNDPAAAMALLDEMGRDVHGALEAARDLARRVYPPLIETGGLGAALRTAAASAGVRARVEVAAGVAWPPEVAGTVYFCCVESLERAGAGTKATVSVREEDGALVFEIVADGGPGVASAGADLTATRDRVEALGGRLAIASEPGDRTRISGALPLER
jgi:signal transduction histidine kinase